MVQGSVRDVQYVDILYSFIYIPLLLTWEPGSNLGENEIKKVKIKTLRYVYLIAFL